MEIIKEVLNIKQGVKCRCCSKKLKYNKDTTIKFKSYVGELHMVYLCEDCCAKISELVKS